MVSRALYISKQAILGICSFEAVFVMFLFSGAYKSDPRFAWIPIDLTMLCMMLGLLWGSFILIQRKFKVPRSSYIILAFYFLFAGYALISLLWSPSMIYGQDKIVKLLTINAWSVLASAWIIAPSARRVKRFYYVIAAFAIWIALEGMKVYFQSGGEGFINVMGGNYLAAGRIISHGAIVAVGFLLFRQSSWIMRLLYIAILGLCTFQLLVGGGRGPFLATLLGFIVPCFVAVRIAIRGLFIRKFVFYGGIAIAVSTIFVVMWMQSETLPQTILRLLMLFSSNGEMEGSAYARVSFAQLTMDYWMQRPLFGSGIGSWSILFMNEDIRSYPHNIIFEILVELGAVGLIMFLIFVGAAIQCLLRWQKEKRDDIHFILIMFVMSMLLNVLVSGDMPDNREWFALIGLFPIFSKVQQVRQPLRVRHAVNHNPMKEVTVTQ
ncbi:O-antigen ligase family protein [Paenibacillus sp. KN14-4R]|uniref:O-antigen ligase family protein n=1 Tax=Paenibacillus sp. KN14-4R TaxID=3445773 RepID=UPI003FA11210